MMVCFVYSSSLFSNVPLSVQSERIQIRETYNLTLIARESLDAGLYSRDLVYDTTLRVLRKLNYDVFSSDRQDGIVISRLHSFRIRLSTMGGNDIFSKSNPVGGRHFFLVMRIVVDDTGKRKLDCMIANRFSEGNLESLGERLLNRFMTELDAELSSRGKTPVL
jgi:hypothetical protein